MYLPYYDFKNKHKYNIHTEQNRNHYAHIFLKDILTVQKICSAYSLYIRY